MAIGFTMDDFGLQTLSVKGVSFLSGALLGTDSVIGDVIWRDEVETTVNRPTINQAVTKTSGADFAEHTYGSGGRTLTLRFTYTATDFRTLRVKVKVTNTGTETIARIGTFPFGYNQRSFQIPGSSSASRPASQVVHVGSVGGGASDEGELVPGHIFHGSWGHCAVWSKNLGNNQALVVPWTGSAGQTLFNPTVRNYSRRQNTNNSFGIYYEDTIEPAAIWEYEFYARFGPSTLAAYRKIMPGASVAVEQAFPNLIRWTNRQPLGRGFICQPNHTSEINPNGYWGDENFDVSNSAEFLTRALTFANNAVTIMNGQDPSPQGIMIWDLEGNPSDASVYRGAPHLIATLAPEMDLAADAFFDVFEQAGYIIGMTLRADTLVLTNGVYIHHYPANEDDAVDELRLRVSYARDRWNAKMFYIDSCRLDIDQDGSADVFLPFRAWRTIQAEFPDCIFIPEQENNYCYGATAPYNEVQGGIRSTPALARDIYRRSFSFISPFGGDLSDTTQLVDSVSKGDAMFVDGYRYDVMNDTVAAIYAAAEL